MHTINLNKTKKFFRENRDLLVTRADKGNKIVIMTNTHYEDKINEL